MDASCRDLGESTYHAFFEAFLSIPHLLLAIYNYPPLNASQYYVAPKKSHSGDLKCDCNTVMYKYEFQSFQGRSCANLASVRQSLHGVCFVSRWPDLPVRSWAASTPRPLLTAPQMDSVGTRV